GKDFGQTFADGITAGQIFPARKTRMVASSFEGTETVSGIGKTCPGSVGAQDGATRKHWPWLGV
ncbi:MAG TPA: hypothetical protein VIS99_14345, partial [Terrimicrobiaceae bacterium]